MLAVAGSINTLYVANLSSLPKPRSFDSFTLVAIMSSQFSAYTLDFNRAEDLHGVGFTSEDIIQMHTTDEEGNTIIDGFASLAQIVSDKKLEDYTNRGVNANPTDYLHKYVLRSV